MPRPISAGVLGMLRTIRARSGACPSAWAIVSLRMPAITLSCSAPATKGLQGAAACANNCGLTAQTTSDAPDSVGSAAARQRRPKSVCSLSRWASKGSTTRMSAGERPARISPPIKALAMLPPPTKTIVDGCLTFIRSVYRSAPET